jgi:2-amino-4-hydroxy-6-hydroxymethyldihydropteridine diphosphokinase
MAADKIKVFLALGSNLGDKLSNLILAEKLLEENDVNILKKSKIYITPPYGYEAQDDFLNECVLGETLLPPLDLLNTIHDIEKRLKRKRIIHWGPRTIDIDILFYGKDIIKLPNLTIPHPEIQYRPFVLRPLMDLDPDFVHPLLNESIACLYSKIEDNCTEYKKD